MNLHRNKYNAISLIVYNGKALIDRMQPNWLTNVESLVPRTPHTHLLSHAVPTYLCISITMHARYLCTDWRLYKIQLFLSTNTRLQCLRNKAATKVEERSGKKTQWKMWKIKSVGNRYLCGAGEMNAYIFCFYCVLIPSDCRWTGGKRASNGRLCVCV